MGSDVSSPHWSCMCGPIWFVGFYVFNDITKAVDGLIIFQSEDFFYNSTGGMAFWWSPLSLFWIVSLTSSEHWNTDKLEHKGIIMIFLKRSLWSEH